MRIIVELDELAQDGLSYEEHVLGLVADKVRADVYSTVDRRVKELVETSARERIEQALAEEIDRQVNKVKLNGYIAGHSFHDATWGEVIGKVLDSQLSRLRDSQWQSDRSPAAAAIRTHVEKELVKDINQSLAAARAELRGTLHEKAAEVLAETVRRTTAGERF